jgi:hypothetical protein
MMVLCGLVAILLGSEGIHAQQSAPDAEQPPGAASTPLAYAVIDYMRVPQGSEQRYLDLERTWKKVHDARRELGIIDAWATFRVRRPASEGGYNFATVQLYKDWSKLENPYPMDRLLPKLALTEQDQERLSETDAVRDFIRSELWQLETAAVPERLGKLGFDKAATFVFMKSKDPAHVSVETEIWQRIFKRAADDGLRWNWTLWSARFPSGTDNPYDVLAIHTFPEGRTDRSWPEGWFDKAVTQLFPTAEQRTRFAATPNMRDEVAVEQWSLEVSTGP